MRKIVHMAECVACVPEGRQKSVGPDSDDNLVGNGKKRYVKKKRRRREVSCHKQNRYNI
jgi:hypothetical protein